MSIMVPKFMTELWHANKDTNSARLYSSVIREQTGAEVTGTPIAWGRLAASIEEVRDSAGDIKTKYGHIFFYPSYAPIYEQLSYDVKVVNLPRAMFPSFKSPLLKGLMVQTNDAFVKQIQTMTLSNGTATGQIGRMKASYYNRHLGAYESVYKRKAGGKLLLPPQTGTNFLKENFTNKRDNHYGFSGSQELYNAFVSEILPFGKREKKTVIATNNLHLQDLLNRHANIRDASVPVMVRINLQSDAGLMWSQRNAGSVKTRAEVFHSDYILGSMMLDCIESIDRSTGGAVPQHESDVKDRVGVGLLADKKNGTLPGKDTFWKIWQFLSLAKAKPKFEVMERLKHTEKSRSIFVMQSFSFMPAQLVWRPAYLTGTTTGTEKVNAQNNPEESNMLNGFSPFHGGLETFLNDRVRLAALRGYDFLIYADNLYIILIGDDGNVEWYSVDGSSMEASIHVNDVKAENRRLLSDYWGHGSDNTGIRSSYASYMTAVNPQLVADNVAVLSNQQIPLPGMASGAVGTMYYNSSKMARVALYLLAILLGKWNTLTPDDLKAYKRGEFANKLQASLLRQSMFNLKESAKIIAWNDQPYVRAREGFGLSGVTGALRDAAALAGVTLKLEMVSVFDLAEINSSTRTFVPLDLLGWDMAWVKVPDLGLDGGYPVLNRNRLEAAMVYNKTERAFGDARRQKVDEVPAEMELNLKDLVRHKAFYALGGWFYPGLGMVSQRRAFNIVMTTKALEEVDVGVYVDAIRSLQPDFRQSVLESLNDGSEYLLRSPTIPLMYDMSVLLNATAAPARQALQRLVTSESLSEAVRYAGWDAAEAMVEAKGSVKARSLFSDANKAVAQIKSSGVRPSDMEVAELADLSLGYNFPVATRPVPQPDPVAKPLPTPTIEVFPQGKFVKPRDASADAVTDVLSEVTGGVGAARVASQRANNQERGHDLKAEPG
jgi:hypothetical protein